MTIYTELPKPFAYYVDDEDGGREYNGLPAMSCGRKGAPLFTADQMSAYARDTFLAGYEAAQADAKVCHVPPPGWRCTRDAGHDGPCAAVEDDTAALVAGGMARLRAADPSNGPPITDSRCEYLYWPTGRCDKCGNVHNGLLPGASAAVSKP